MAQREAEIGATADAAHQWVPKALYTVDRVSFYRVNRKYDRLRYPEKKACPCHFSVDRVASDPRPCYFTLTVSSKIGTVSHKTDRVKVCDNFSAANSGILAVEKLE